MNRGQRGESGVRVTHEELWPWSKDGVKAEYEGRRSRGGRVAVPSLWTRTGKTWSQVLLPRRNGTRAVLDSLQTTGLGSCSSRAAACQLVTGADSLHFLKWSRLNVKRRLMPATLSCCAWLCSGMCSFVKRICFPSTTILKIVLGTVS